MSPPNPTLNHARRRPTIKDVARHAEVSVGTVSAVINGSPHVSEKNHQRVLQSIAELEYEPNTAARSLKRQLSSSIGLIMPNLQNMFFTSVASGVQHFARQNDMLMVLGTTGSESKRCCMALLQRFRRDMLMLPEAEGFELSLCLTLMTTRRVDFGALRS